jgi:hypothetical protein
MAAIEHNLAFSFNDKDFTDFLPEDPEEQLKAPWADFNIHDPGVTTYEALNFSFIDLTYRFNRPIQNIMKGSENSALNSWNLSNLRPFYAVTKNDYRTLIASFKLAVNAAVHPSKKANIAQGKYRPMSLLNTDIASNSSSCRNLGDHVLIQYRALGEYFNRQVSGERFLNYNVEFVKVKVDVLFKQREENKANKVKLKCAIANYLLPKLTETNFRYVQNIEDLIMSQYFGPPVPHRSSSVILYKNMMKPSYRRFIIVSELIEVIEQLDFIESIKNVGIGLLDQPYQNTVLDLGRYCFTKLFDLILNEEQQPNIDDPKCDKQNDQVDLVSPEIEAKFQNLGQFHSIQGSFPNNYGIGSNVQNQSIEQLGQTGNFRTYLYFFDQIRSDILAQLGSLPKAFTINNTPGMVEFRPIRETILYKDLDIKFGHCKDEEFREVRIEAFTDLQFREKRLNYLLALNGWTIDEEIPDETKDDRLLNIKREFLNLVHYESIFNTNISKDHYPDKKNSLFYSKSLLSLKNKIHTILQYQVASVRILEHVFLQPVWNRKEDFDFAMSIFLFPLDTAASDQSEIDIYSRTYKNYVYSLIRSFVPVHIVVNILWCTDDKTVELFDRTLDEAYPTSDIFYFDNPITKNQETAMTSLMNDWVFHRN